MAEIIRTFEPVAGTLTHVLLDSWYTSKRIWKVARERGFPDHQRVCAATGRCA
jgi:hypothetical protein